MAAGIDGLLANLQGGGARANRYEVILTFPKGVGSVQIAQKLSFLCKASAVPAFTLGEAIVPYKGRQVKLPGDATFDDWNVTVILDNDYATRNVFEDWLNKINGWTSNTAVAGYQKPTTLFGSGIIHHLDREDKIIKTYNVQGIWPKLVGEIALGYDTNDAVAEQAITFAVNNIQTKNSR